MKSLNTSQPKLQAEAQKQESQLHQLQPSSIVNSEVEHDSLQTSTTTSRRALIDNIHTTTAQKQPTNDEAATKTESELSTLPLWHRVMIEVKYLMYLSIPTLLNHVGNTLIEMETFYFLGKLAESHLASVHLGNSVHFICSYICFGMTEALDTLISEAFGSSNKEIIPFLVVRTVILITALMVPISAVYLLLAKPLLVMLGQDALTSEYAQVYLRYLFLSLWPNVMVRILQSLTIAQNIILPSVTTMIVSLLVNAGLNYCLMFAPMNLGFIGSPIATSISYWIQLIIFVVSYIAQLQITTWIQARRSTPTDEEVPEESLEEYEAKQESTRYYHIKPKDLIRLFRWQELKEYFKISVPDTFGMMIEMIGYEISIFMSGYLGNLELTSHGILMNFYYFSFLFNYSFSNSITVRVAQLLGRNQHNQARLSSIVCILLVILLKSLNVIAILCLNIKLVQWIFTSEEEVLTYIQQSYGLIFVALIQYADGIHSIISAIFRAIGKTWVSAVVYSVGYFGVSVPIGLLLCFYPFKLGMTGLWVALSASLALQAFSLTLLFHFGINWKQQAEISIRRSTFSDCTMSSQESPEMTEVSELEEFEISPTEAAHQQNEAEGVTLESRPMAHREIQVQ